MKKLYFATMMVLCLFFASLVGAHSLSWDEQAGIDGFKVYYNSLDLPGDVTDVDVGNVTVFDLDDIGLTKGT